eukprot:COSAG02_NODE_2013_length_10111_cov_24.161039_4_plen_130_part_00
MPRLKCLQELGEASVAPAEIQSDVNTAESGASYSILTARLLRSTLEGLSVVGVVAIGGGGPAAGQSNNKAAKVLPNLQFVEGDMSEVAIEQGAFVVSVHGKSESLMECPLHRVLLLVSIVSVARIYVEQ